MRPLLLLLALAASGCASFTHAVDLADPSRANADFAGRDATVILTDGAEYDAVSLRLEPDTTTWVDPGSGQLLAIPTSAVAVVQRRDRGRAVWRTARNGALVGAAVGAVLGGIVGNEFVGAFGQPTTSERASGVAFFGVVFGVGAGIEGGVIGALAGLVVDPTERYVVEPAPLAAPAGGP